MWDKIDKLEAQVDHKDYEKHKVKVLTKEAL